jgi:Na+-transporting methylmalonyl-CoA/oxaloacetate decarboxylase gamma subunit
MNNIEQGLAIMVVGLGLTFSALAIFIGVILALRRLFPVRQEPDSAKQETGKQIIGPLGRDTGEEEIAVAITVALAHLYAYELCRSNLGVALEQGHGPWWMAGRLEQYPLDAVQIQGRN